MSLSLFVKSVFVVSAFREFHALNDFGTATRTADGRNAGAQRYSQLIPVRWTDTIGLR